MYSSMPATKQISSVCILQRCRQQIWGKNNADYCWIREGFISQADWEFYSKVFRTAMKEDGS